MTTERGEDLEAYRLMLVKAIREGKPANGRLEYEKWDPTPLGQPVEATETPRPAQPSTAEPAHRRPTDGEFVVLTQDGRSRSCLVTADRPSQNETHVATVIEEHLAAMTGANIEILKATALGEVAVSSAGVKPADAKWRNFSFVLVGACPLSGALGVVTDGLGPEGIALKTMGNAVVVAGKDDAGLRHAAYTLLESVGCRYLWPGELGKVVPRTPASRSVSSSCRLGWSWRSARWNCTRRRTRRLSNRASVSFWPGRTQRTPSRSMRRSSPRTASSERRGLWAYSQSSREALSRLSSPECAKTSCSIRIHIRRV